MWGAERLCSCSSTNLLTIHILHNIASKEPYNKHVQHMYIYNVCYLHVRVSIIMYSLELLVVQYTCTVHVTPASVYMVVTARPVHGPACTCTCIIIYTLYAIIECMVWSNS